MSTTLKSLMSDYFENADAEDKKNIKPSFLKEIAVPSGFSVPIVPDESAWTVVEAPQRLQRTFKFSSIDLRNCFISELLSYEQEFGHYAKTCVEEMRVTIEVYTHNLMSITELDHEYAEHCSSIFDDLKLWNFNNE